MKGFTLIEIVVSIAIMSVVILALFAAFDAGNTLYSTNVKIMDMMKVVRVSVEAIIKEVRQSSVSDILITNSGAKIQFKVPTGLSPMTYSQPIAYYLDADNQLIREHPPGTTAVLATNVDSINFVLSSGRLEITAQLRADLKSQDLVLPIKETITLRN